MTEEAKSGNGLRTTDNIVVVLFAVVALGQAVAVLVALPHPSALALAFLLFIEAASCCIALYRERALRYVRLLAIVHAAVGVVLLWPGTEYLHDFSASVGAGAVAIYLAFNFVLPIVIAILAHQRVRRPHILDMVYGDPEITRQSHSLSAGHCIAIVVGTIVVAGVMQIGGAYSHLMVATFGLSILFGGAMLFAAVRALYRLLRGTDYSPPPMVARRIKLRSRQTQRARMQHYWTVTTAGENIPDEEDD